MGISSIPYTTGSAHPSNFPVSCLLSSKSHESPREGASLSFHKDPLISALNKANQCSLPQGRLLLSGFPHREETQCPEEMGRHILHRDPGSCKSCLSAWSGCNFGVIYSDYSFNLNLNWMLQVAQPVLLRLEHPHWVRPVYKSSELNIFIGSCHAFFSWVQTLAIYYAAPFPRWGRNQPFVSAWNQQHVHSPH